MLLMRDAIDTFLSAISFLIESIYGIAVGFPAYFIVNPILHFLALPYTLKYFSSNWSLLCFETQPGELYLHHFERLHPDLIEHVRAAYAARTNKRPPRKLKFWPRETSHIILPLVVAIREWKFSCATGLFALLEDCGWDRTLLWTFLRDQVENAGLVSAEEKVAFARVMEVACSNRFKGIRPAWVRSLQFLRKWTGETERSSKMQQAQIEKLKEKFDSLGVPVIAVSGNCIDWVLQRNAVLVLDQNIRDASYRMKNFQPIWINVKNSQDPEKISKSYWQQVSFG
ncbi:hypothetical protein N7499_004234 [Penicillium canescens]|uniref:Uncharacterized protein n=1 Tax=Penicillium canescens TaxID=5083 RepID=A0AAD6IA67_PENCN|nr:uncharacterized protein N7446_005103 [Penicillium canescens]KAJ6038289.1 hypothetical protein N7460_008060 [Penicillium canescens]KAJ6039590.1 hypothetical protein N7444_008495 [Penicillium canescens]KAJ6068066.1 hypothetical protein N7446_005103 [Penicillium canescens]KAJ6088052.1 hypothetical protein N7499_004234 [Penicillium canescens]KAJ6181445.1 hypothetical protein N7485_000087 [Penicillium canescens]